MGSTPVPRIPEAELDIERRLERIDDELLATHGHPITGPYFDRFYLPLLGPAIAVMVRHVAIHHGELTTLRHLGRRLGLGSDLTRLTVARAARVSLMKLTPHFVQVPAHVAPLTRRQFDRLPGFIAAELRALEQQ